MSELELISKSIDKLAHHMEIFNGEMGEVLVRVSVLESQMADVLWLQRLLLGTVIVAIVGAILALVLKKRNNK